MNSLASNMSDERLMSVVSAIDRVSKPLDQRFEGDDEVIVELMAELGLKQDLVGKLLITGEVLRECAHRGLQIPRPNTHANESDSGLTLSPAR